MRKQLIDVVQLAPSPLERNWLNTEELARVELTSEEADHPIESALQLENGLGWRASKPGIQTIRLIFDHPLPVHRISLSFVEPIVERTQEYVLRWSTDDGQSFQELLRQQWNFSPRGATLQTEDYHVDLAGLTVLELTITPDIGRSDAYASLAQLRIA